MLGFRGARVPLKGIYKGYGIYKGSIKGFSGLGFRSFRV